MSENTILALVVLVVFGPIAAIMSANWLRDRRFAQLEANRLAAGGEIFDDVPAGLDLRNEDQGLRRLRPDRVEPQSYTWTERRPNELPKPGVVDLQD